MGAVSVDPKLIAYPTFNFTYCDGLAFRILLLSPPTLPVVELLDLLGAGVAPLEPEGVEFNEEAISLAFNFYSQSEI